LKLNTLHKPDAFLSISAFNDARSGLACSEICRRVKADLSIPAATGMFQKNNGTESYRHHGAEEDKHSKEMEG